MYTDIYTSSLPRELLAMAETPVMQRLSHIGMHCGCEYTAYPIYRDALAPYSRYTHTLGTAAIVWHFTHDLKQAVAGLLHDIATPAFAHVVDFLNGDHLRQESTESRTRAMLASSPELMALLDKSGLTIDDVDDYHRYPIADNDSPRLSADRLEYTLGNAHLVFHCPKEKLKRIFDDLFIGKNEDGCCVSFESFAYEKLGYETVYELGPGEIVEITKDGYKTLAPPGDKMCICAFLWNCTSNA